MRLKKLFVSLVSVILMAILAGCAASVQNLPAPLNVEPVKFEDTRAGYLPGYDINNTPISVWIIKDGTSNVGFIVSGHARKAVCQVASIEVMTLFDEIGKNTDSFFSFGIGYDLRPKSGGKWSYSYHEKIGDLERKLGDLSHRHPRQVTVRDINYNTYCTAIETISKHIKRAAGSTWDTHVVEYKYNDSPLIVPFQYLDTSHTIKIRIPESYFGELPTKAALSAASKILDDAYGEINRIKKQNDKTLKELSLKSTSNRNYDAWSVEAKRYVLRRYRISGYPEAPTGFKVREIDALTGLVVSTRDISAEEAKNMLNKVDRVDPSVKQELEEWVRRCDNHEVTVNKEKDRIRTVINDTSRELKKEFAQLDSLREKIRKRNEDGGSFVDAFLRGWPVSTSNLGMNDRIRKWYRENRSYIWGQILDHIPNSRVNILLAGVFHADDVFFKVTKKSNYYEITPYKVIGGEFIQVINKKIGISQYFTPYNFRY